MNIIYSYYKTTFSRIPKSAHLRLCWSIKSHPSCTFYCYST